MTVSSTTNRVTYTANGINDTFAFTFRIFNDSDLVVYNGGILQGPGDYTVEPNEDPTTGGNVIFTDPPASGNTIILYRELPLTQLTDYQEGDAFPAETHEAALDRLVMIAQQFSEAMERFLKLPTTSTLTGIEIPVGANKGLRWNSAGDNFELFTVDPSTTSVITTQGDIVVGDASGVPERYAIGAAGTILKVVAGNPTWEPPSSFKLDDWGTPDDNTDLNVSITKHGLCPKAPNDTGKFLRGDASWAAVPPDDFTKIKHITPVNKINWNAATDWTDVDITAHVGSDTPTAAIIAWELDFSTATDSVWALMKGLARVNGSSETAVLPTIKGAAFYVTAGAGVYCRCYAGGFAVVPVDGSKVFEVKLQTDGGTPSAITFKVNLLGYTIN